MSKPLPQLIIPVSSSRFESMVPRDFRIARYPDGSRRVQGGYAWSQGKEGGITWKDLPMVFVDETGQEIK